MKILKLNSMGTTSTGTCSQIRKLVLVVVGPYRYDILLHFAVMKIIVSDECTTLFALLLHPFACFLPTLLKLIFRAFK